MTIAAWIIAGALAYLALGAFVGSGLRTARETQTRPMPPVERVDQDRPLDITPALERDSARWN